jgi:hypothetical protein
MRGGDVNKENTGDGAGKAFQQFVLALREIEGKVQIEEEDVLRLTTLLGDYSRNPDSTEERRLNASKEVDRIRAMYVGKNNASSAPQK